MKLLTLVGARPQFIKAAPLSLAIREAGHTQFLLHTGQHYDHGMSQVFFEELGLPEADLNLGVGSGSHGWQTGQMIFRIEEVLLKERPDWVIVLGDTNTTLAGALATAKLHLRLAHVEAGLRSYNRSMPEEHNRVLTDHCSDLLFCPTKTAVENLAKEGLTRGIFLVGDPMYDAVMWFDQRAQQRPSILQRLGLEQGNYLLATVHRAYNTDDPARLGAILHTLFAQGEEVIFPLHPRTRQKIQEYRLLEGKRGKLHLIEPLGYLDMLQLEKNARCILTDSGGIQKEAYFFAVPCLTLRPETEWIETVNSGWNLLVDADPVRIQQGLQHSFPTNKPPTQVFGDGHAAEAIIHHLGEEA